MTLTAPFPWFGGKRRVAHLVWPALGDVSHYVEPFAGSLAVLLARPSWHRSRSEVVNDLDAYVANFWRALAAEPEAVAEAADWPVNEVDLLARHRWLVDTGKDRLRDIEADPEHFDARVAGWWVWGLSCWIGGGWCHDREDGRQPEWTSSRRPHLGRAMGVHSVGRNRPDLHCNRGVQSQDVFARFAALTDRLRRVKVCCGDWSRVVTDASTVNNWKTGTVGVFLDPPYATDLRARGCYANDGSAGTLSSAVRGWALEKGGHPHMRIVLCGYEEEHAEHMPESWRKVAWTATGAPHSRRAGTDTRGNRNRDQERLWFSPGCLCQAQQELFGSPQSGEKV